MNMNRMVMALVAGAGLLIGYAPLVAAQVSLVCPVDGAQRDTATIPRSAVGPLATLGGVGHDDAQEIKDAAWFSTVCPVVLDEKITTHSGCLEGVENPIAFKNMQMQIQRVTDAAFRMWLLNPVSGEIVAFVPSMGAYQAGAAPAFAEEAGPPFEYLRGTGADGNVYFVYFQSGLSGRDLGKHYKIEVYYKASTDSAEHLCQSHMPNKPINESEDDPNPVVQPREGGIGQGGEPPPGNP